MHKSKNILNFLTPQRFTVSLFTFCLFAFSFSWAQEKNKIIKTDTLKTTNSTQPNSPQAEEGDVKITDGTNTLIRITDEGTFGAIEIKNGVPSTTTDKLYNDAGTLKFNGSTLGGGSGATEINDLTDAKYDGTSLFLGTNAGANDDGTSNENTAIGKGALHLNTSGYANTAIGTDALRSNTTGYENTVNGHDALSFNTTGYYNTAIGSGTLFYNTTGNNNTAIGTQALASNSTGNYNTANGAEALISNTTGNNNTAIGHQALYSNTTGVNNVASGNYALANNTSGGNNTAVGYLANKNNSTNNNNTAIGSEALRFNDLGNNNTAVGNNALWQGSGNDNVAVGFNSLYSANGNGNVGIGRGAMYYNATGGNNVGIGFQTDVNNSSGSNNTIVGHQAGGGTTINTRNGSVFIGYQAGFDEITNDKLYIENSNSSSPLIWGDFANDIAAIGGEFCVGTHIPEAKVTIIAATSGEVPLRIKIGGGTKFKVEENGGVAIGINHSTPANGLYVHGDLNYNAALTSVSDKRFKTNIKPIENAMERIKNIRGVYYDWNRAKFPERDFTDKKQIGVLAQDVEKEFPELVRIGDDGYKSVDYTKLAPILIEAVKEQDIRIKTLEKENQNLQAVINENKNLRNEIKIIKAALNKIVREKAEIKVSSK